MLSNATCIAYTLGGVKVHGSNSEEAMMEIEFSWAGGLDVVVGLGPR